MIERLLSGPVEVPPCEGVGGWWLRHRELGALCGDPFSRAIACGFAADRVGWAFASGYQAALHALFPDAPDDRICALCVTEADGNSPKAIMSSLRRHGGGWLLNGVKRWTTLGPDGAQFYVAARDEAASGERPSIRVARIDSNVAGLHIEEMPPAKFVPEVPHAQLRFHDVPVASLLPGDGYAAYVKPFRTIEDIHVNAAILAYLLREARRLAWPPDWAQRCASILVCLQGLAARSPASPATHIALAGALAIVAEQTAQAGGLWEMTPMDPAAARWTRDLGLFGVAARARSARTERAWQRLV